MVRNRMVLGSRLKYGVQFVCCDLQFGDFGEAKIGEYNFSGELEKAKCGLIGVASNVKAELVAILKGLELCVATHLFPLWLESDSLIALKILEANAAADYIANQAFISVGKVSLRLLCLCVLGPLLTYGAIVFGVAGFLSPNSKHRFPLFHMVMLLWYIGCGWFLAGYSLKAGVRYLIDGIILSDMGHFGLHDSYGISFVFTLILPLVFHRLCLQLAPTPTAPSILPTADQNLSDLRTFHLCPRPPSPRRLPKTHPTILARPPSTSTTCSATASPLIPPPSTASSARLLLDADLLHTASSLFRKARTQMPHDEHSLASATPDSSTKLPFYLTSSRPAVRLPVWSSIPA
ncbi:hypothetical protein ZIOFF_009804 [Zingiber officinale]|uniref:Uncharacterized protein n=1 Tax=Zingiber officinale TaxID=94328 RepID=A0A8J5HNM0_ZINOF|nr:hypothetical protein ZIOFF_009804 [Zingiber officinale]